MSSGLASRMSRIHQSESGIWERKLEGFPVPAQLQDESWSGFCNPRLADVPKENPSEVVDAVTQLQFAQNVKECLEAVSAEWHWRWQQEKNRAAYEMLAQLVGATTELFGENVRVYESCDPEFPEDRFVVFAVKSDMEPAEVVRAQGEWRKAFFTIAPGCDSFRLLAYPK